MKAMGFGQLVWLDVLIALYLCLCRYMDVCIYYFYRYGSSLFGLGDQAFYMYICCSALVLVGF